MNVGRDYFEIEAELKKRIEGDIHFDKYSRLLYSTDASIYQIEPIGVVVPRHKGGRASGDRSRQSTWVSRSCRAAAALHWRVKPSAIRSSWIFPSTCRTFWK